MWEGDGWSGAGIYEGTKKNRVFLAWMHQIDILLIRGSEQLGIKGYLINRTTKIKWGKFRSKV